MKKWKKKCPKCGEKIKNQGTRTRKIHTGRTGYIQLNRNYYTCMNKECNYSILALDRILDISPNEAGGKFEDKICMLASELPFETVHSILEKENIKVSETMIRNTVRNCGKALIESEELEEKEIAKEKAEILYIQVDGSMVPIQGKKKTEYKECKLGIFFKGEDIIEKKSKEMKKSHRISKKRYVSSIGQGVEEFERKWLRKAKSYESKEKVFLSDGAVWIENMIRRHYPYSTCILDWYHAVEHLWDCGKTVYGEAEKEKVESFVKPLEKLLWEGEIELLCKELLSKREENPKKESKIMELYSYYNTRKEKMRYKEYREKGYFIGSGSVESANKYLVKQRLNRSGMRWTIPVAEAVLKIREKVYEKTWDLLCSNKHFYFSY